MGSSNVDISAYPWLCSTTAYNTSYTCYNEETGNIVTEGEGNNAEVFTTEAYGTYGLKFTYYKILDDIRRDKLFGEDTLRMIERAFYVIGYTDKIPPNVRTYQLQGIWGEDVMSVTIGISAFKYWSTYGEEDRNTPNVYDFFEPRIGDLMYLEPNDTFYEIRDVKYYNEAFGLAKHTYTLTLKVYKDFKATIDKIDPTLRNQSDPIWKVAPHEMSEAQPTKDILKLNDVLSDKKLKKSKNANRMNVMYKSEKKTKVIDSEETNNENVKKCIDPFDGW